MNPLDGQITPEDRPFTRGEGFLKSLPTVEIKPDYFDELENKSTPIDGLAVLENRLRIAQDSEPSQTTPPQIFNWKAARLPVGKIALPAQADPAFFVVENEKVFSLARPGSIGIITAKAKGAKSAVLGALLAGAIRNGSDIVDSLGIGVLPCPTGKRCVHIDTESSEFEYRRFVRNVLKRTAYGIELPEKLHSFPLRNCEIGQRIETLESILFDPDAPPTHAVFIDGLTDLLFSVNDEKETVQVVETFLQWAQKLETVFVFVVHENQKSTSGGGARGWIGSQLERKVSFHLQIKSNEDGTKEIEFANCREAGEIRPRRFMWCDENEMFVSDGVGTGKQYGGRPKKIDNETEKEITDLFTKGESKREIARKLGISESTVRNYLAKK